MNTADEAIFQAICEAKTLRTRTKKGKSLQVTGAETDIIRATALAWFNNHRKQLMSVFSSEDLSEVDEHYKWVVEASHRNATRSRYISKLKEIKRALVELRSANVVGLSATPAITTDQPPDFTSLISDAQMKEILERRWVECTLCMTAGAPLAATVMIGGLLEGLLLARILHETNKAPIFTAAAAPKDSQSKTLQLKEWTLQHYIDVAHELKWISVAAKDVSVVLRDYRNYVHPQKQLSHGVSMSSDDAQILWEVSKGIARQVLSSVP